MSTDAKSSSKIMSDVPVIDLSEYRTGSDITTVVDQVRSAISTVGFFQVVGHGVSVELLKAVCDSFEQLVTLPEHAKHALASPTGHPFRGLSALYDDDGGLRVERFQVCAIENPDHAAELGVDRRHHDYFHPNVWPDDAETKALWLRCFESTRALGALMMEIFARALELEPGFFANKLELDVSTFSGNYYPPQSRLSTVEQPNVIFREHSDSGMLTLLYQRGEYTGLQIQNGDGSWLLVPVVEDAFIVNIGDLMSRWTNGRWPATRHRVIAPTEPGQARTSLPTFFLPSVDVEVAPLPSCIGPEGAQFDPVTPYEWEAMFLARNPETIVPSKLYS